MQTICIVKLKQPTYDKGYKDKIITNKLCMYVHASKALYWCGLTLNNI